MRFGEHFLDELKTRIRVSDVVGKSVKLKRQGREFAGLSPFTNEKTPSFFVNDEKGFYHCFSSGKHGDSISFLMETQGLSFPEAVERLATDAGMALPTVDPDAEKRAQANKKTIRWIEHAQSFFERSLHRTSGSHDAAQARAYLKSRSLGSEDCKRFGIGFAPDSFDALRTELTQAGATIPDLVEAGLLIEPDDKNKTPWDRFRSRIIFPIADARGRLVAFGGRAMDTDAKAKYLNSPETNIFHKGRLLYRYPEARKALHDPKNPARGLIVSEGYMDVIALVRAGFKHACAPLGTALTEDQLSLLWRAGPEPILCFDGDKAGLRAAFRSIDRALPLLQPGKTLRFALLPDGQDPDDLIRDKGKTAMADVLEKSIPLVDLLWRREVEAERLDTPEARAGLKDRIFKLTNEIAHAGVKDQYKTELLSQFDKAFGRKPFVKKPFNGNSNAKWSQNLRPTKAQETKMRETALIEARERRVIGAVLFWPEMLEHIDQTLFSLEFSTETCRELQNSLLIYWQNAIAVDKRGVLAHMEDNGHANQMDQFRRERNLIAAATGGIDTSIETRIQIWQREARAMDSSSQTASERETRDRMIDTIQAENRDALARLKRLSKDKRH